MFVKSMAFAILLILPAKLQLPVGLIGEWRVGTGYDSQNQPVGLNNDQDRRIRKSHVILGHGEYTACGRHIRVETVASAGLSADEFATRYGMNPERLGFSRGQIDEFSINGIKARGACGDFNDPGTHLFSQSNSHVVMEVANGYYPLVRLAAKTASAAQSKAQP